MTGNLAVVLAEEMVLSFYSYFGLTHLCYTPETNTESYKFGILDKHLKIFTDGLALVERFINICLLKVKCGMFQVYQLRQNPPYIMLLKTKQTRPNCTKQGNKNSQSIQGILPLLHGRLNIQFIFMVKTLPLQWA